MRLVLSATAMIYVLIRTRLNSSSHDALSTDIRTYTCCSPLDLVRTYSSALDSHTENDVIDALSALADGRTAIFVAHRLSTAARCDNIAVVHDGTIAEMGSHEDLLKKSGLYAAMWDAQSKDSENGSALVDDDVRVSDSFEVNNTSTAGGSVR